MRSSLAIATFVFVAAASSARADLPTVAHRYALRASVDLRTHDVTGELVLDFRNTSRAALPSIVFHRYLEAFRNRQSVFARESHGELRGVALDGSGGLELRSIRVEGVERVEAIARELVPNDFTQFELPLATPLAPGASIRVVIGFVARLPKLAARAGYVGDFHVLGQWFPKPAKLEDDGRFASFPYHGLGEFYADFADYDVTLDVPADAVVEGTGRIVASHASGRRRIVRFVARAVHDAAYVVARGFETTTRTCGGIVVRTTFPPGYASAADEHTDATCFGLAYLGRRLAPYPYDTLTVIVPPRGAEGGAGMEYPTAFLADGPWHRTAFLPHQGGIDTTMHELAHQWFQGLVATNEVENPVLDEGLASFYGYDLVRAFTGRSDAAHFDVWRPFVTREGMIPAGRTIEEFDEDSYGASVYGRSAVVLESIARTYGREKTHRAVGRYVRANLFAHPGKEALLDAFDAEFGSEFGHRTLGPLFYDGELIRFTAVRESGRLVVERRGDARVPVTIALVRGRDVRRVRHTGGRFVAPIGTECVAIDPDSSLLLDARRVDDVACTTPRFAWLENALRFVAAFVLRGLGP